MEKRCPRCREEKPVTDYGKNRRSKDGLAVYCKPCFRQLHEESRDRALARLGKTRKVSPKAPPGTKWCPDCGDFLPYDAFCKNRNNKSGLATYCRACAAQRKKESMSRLHGSSRHYHLVRRYGVSAAEVDAMVERQAGRCPICTQELDERSHVDHDHKTGRVRGVLCFNCNAGLGKYADSPEILVRAADYLLRCLPAPTYFKELDLTLESLDWMPEPVDLQKVSLRWPPVGSGA